MRHYEHEVKQRTAIALKQSQLLRTTDANYIVSNTNATAGRRPAAIQPPLFIANVPGFRNDDVPEDMNFAEDRAYLEAAIRKLSPEAALVADLLSTSTERQFFEMSLRNKRINKEYIRLRVENADVDKKMMIGHLESFLMANEDMSRHASIVELRRNLTEA